MTTTPSVPQQKHDGWKGDPFGERVTARVWVTWLLGVILTALGAWLWLQQSIQEMSQWMTASDQEADAEATVWICPMHPSVTSAKASVCPVCGMDLVPMRPSKEGEHDHTAKVAAAVALSPSQQVVGHYETVSPVEASALHPTNNAAASDRTPALIGRLRPAEDTLAAITSWIPGRVDTLHVNQTGQQIKKGDSLASIYSERLLSAQEEYLSTLDAGALTASLMPAVERKLKLLGMSNTEIKRLGERKKTSPRLTIRARESGTVLNRLVTEGQYVAEGQVLFEVADLSQLWLELDVHLSQLSSLTIGQTLPFTVDQAAAPEVTHTGQITFIDPFVNPMTQTVRVRLVVGNPDGLLQPDMYARAAAPAPPASKKSAPLMLPRSALLHTGQRDIVWLETAPNTFVPHAVQLGRRLGAFGEVEGGLKPSDRVALHAGFLLDPDSPLPASDQIRMQAALEDATVEGRLHVFQHIPNDHLFCPMHPDIHQPNPGRCPKCNMDLLPMSPETRALITAADPLASVPPNHWYCPMGTEWVQEGPGRCPKCNMFLVQKTDTPPTTAPTADTTATHPTDPPPPASPPVVPPGAWFCPMDAEWVQDGPGSCPLCGMALKQQPDPSPSPAPHAHPHPNHPSAQQDPIAAVPTGKFFCPMGAEWVQDSPGPCPLCGMALKQKQETP